MGFEPRQRKPASGTSRLTSPLERPEEITMTSFRKTALVGGILYVLTFLGSIPAAFLVVPVGR